MATPKKEKRKPLVLNIGGFKLELAKALPMQMADYTLLARQNVKIGPNTNLLDDPDALAKFALHFCQKVEERITLEMIQELPLMRVIRAVQYIQGASQEMDDEDPN